MLAMFVPSGVIDTTVFAGDNGFIIEDGVLTHYNGNKEDVVIPKTVRKIGYGAFRYHSMLKSVVIPNSVISIGQDAFENCTGLTRVEIPNSVTSIGEGAFWACMKLTDITIPASVSEIGMNAFGCCTGMLSINVSSGNSRFSSVDGVLFDIDKTELVAYPSGRSGGFVIPASVSIIDSTAFYECKGLTNVTFPSSIQSIGDYAFSGCSRLTSISLPHSVVSIGEAAFYGCSGLTSVTLSRSLTSISNSAFSGCSELSSVALPISVTSIGDFAFEGCVKISSIILPIYVKEIGVEAFSGCSSLKKVVIPNSVILLKGWTFEKCSQLTDVYYTGTQQQWIELNTGEIGQEIYLGINDRVTIHYNYVMPLPSITSHPANVTAKVNDSVSFSVKAQGDGLTYQWYYKKAGQTTWNKWGTRTTATTTATANATWNGMQVYCKVTDQYGNSVDSNPATITIKQDLKITAQPTDKTVKLGESLTLSVKAEGIGLTYQWYYKKSGATSFSKWNGRTHASETVTPNASWNGIQLYCTVKDSSGNSLDSSVAKITVTQDLKITAQPTNKTIKKGDSVTLSLKAEGTGLTYQWYYKKAGATSFSTWNGRTHASETVTPNTTWNGIQLYCVVKDSSGKKVQSNTIKVLFSDVVTIVTQPTNVTAKTGDNVTFKFVAEGVGLTYQWYYKKAGATAWSKWNGRTTASTTATANASWDGMQVYCVVKNSSGSTLNSNIAKITLSDVLAITQQPSNVTTQAGQNVTFTVKAKGVGLKYQWQYKKSGQTSWNNWGARTTASTTATSNATWNGMQVRCIVTDSAGNKVTSNAATITIK